MDGVRFYLLRNALQAEQIVVRHDANNAAVIIQNRHAGDRVAYQQLQGCTEQAGRSGRHDKTVSQMMPGHMHLQAPKIIGAFEVV
jgi:hypothetical protein